ncbi:organic solute transporter subunit alpha-like isoform X2 [Cherax quadricarinatus]
MEDMLPDQNDFHWMNDSEGCIYGYVPTIPEYIEALGQYTTAVHTVGGLITLAFLIFYCEHIIFTYRNTHTVYRRHINWIACFYPVGALMTSLALIVPRAHDACTAIKMIFFSLGARHFLDLTVVMFGCEKAMLARLKDAYIDYHVGILRCCLCIPYRSINKTRLRVLKWMLWQYPYSQTIYFFLEIYCTAAESDRQGLILFNYWYLVLEVFNALTFLSALYALTVLGHLVRDHLGEFGFKRKYGTMLVLLIVLKTTELVITVLGNYDVFPCYPPYINSMVYSHTVLNLAHLLVLTIFGALEYWEYHTEEFLQPISDKHHQHSHELIIHGQACVCIISEMTGFQKKRRVSQLPLVLGDNASSDFKFDENEEKKTNGVEVSFAEETDIEQVPPALQAGGNNKKNGVQESEVDQTSF